MQALTLCFNFFGCCPMLFIWLTGGIPPSNTLCCCCMEVISKCQQHCMVTLWFLTKLWFEGEFIIVLPKPEYCHATPPT